MVALALTYTDAVQLNMAGPIKLGKVARTWLSKGEHICAPPLMRAYCILHAAKRAQAPLGLCFPWRLHKLALRQGAQQALVTQPQLNHHTTSAHKSVDKRKAKGSHWTRAG